MIDTGAVLNNVENAVVNVDDYRIQRHDEAGCVVSSIRHVVLLNQLTGLEWSYDDSEYISEMPLIAQFKHPCGLTATINLDKFASEPMPVTFTDGTRTVTRGVEHAPTLMPTEEYVRRFDEGMGISIDPAGNAVRRFNEATGVDAVIDSDDVHAVGVTYDEESGTWTVAVAV
jgi:hypothetical protein